jgi:hypothetical protein
VQAAEIAAAATKYLHARTRGARVTMHAAGKMCVSVASSRYVCSLLLERVVLAVRYGVVGR